MAVLKPPLVSLDKARRPVAVFYCRREVLSASKPCPCSRPGSPADEHPDTSPLLEPGILPSVSDHRLRVVQAQGSEQ